LFWEKRMAEPNIVRAASPEALARQAADWLTDLAKSSGSRFSIALSGGSTPKRLYEILAEQSSQSGFPWERTHLFWGDERHVPATSPDSNQRMTREALLDHVPIPPQNVHAVPVSRTPEEDALLYQQDMQTYYGDMALDMARPLFDVVLLGLGENGHTASLFPGTPALDEDLAWVAAVTTGVPQPRLTLTYPAIACSRHVAFLVAGASKAAVLKQVLAGDRTQPAARVTTIGQLTWFVDTAAAG
jgi:6-phosphogluconolactonase